MAKRGVTLSLYAALFAGLAVFDLFRPLSVHHYMYFGWRPSGVKTAILVLAISSVNLIYALGIWQMRRWALPMGCVYAAVVILNIVDFLLGRYALLSPDLIVSIIVAIALACGSVILLYRRKASLV